MAMVNGDATALQLRFREHSLPDGPPDVDAFRRPTPTTRPTLAPEEYGVLSPPGPRARDGSFVVFFQHPEFGVPAPGHRYEGVALSSWSLQPTVFGWVATVRPSRERPGALRSAGVLAACLTLAVPFDVAAADAVTADAQAASVDTQPGDEDTSAEFESPRAAEGPTAIDRTVPQPAQPPQPALDPTPPPRSALATDGNTDQALIDAAWEGVDGFSVILELKGGRELRGFVGAVQRDTFTLIEAETGKVRVLPKSGVRSLRVFVAPPVPSKSGLGLLVGGGLLTGTGAPVFLAGVVILGLCPSCTTVHVPLWLIGGVALGAGIPMLVKGAERREAYRRAVHGRSLTPVVARTPHGWSGGLAFRF